MCVCVGVCVCVCVLARDRERERERERVREKMLNNTDHDYGHMCHVKQIELYNENGMRSMLKRNHQKGHDTQVKLESAWQFPMAIFISPKNKSLQLHKNSAQKSQGKGLR